MKCLNCNGEGLVGEKLCPECEGFGYTGTPDVKVEPVVIEEVKDSEGIVEPEEVVNIPVKKIRVKK